MSGSEPRWVSAFDFDVGERAEVGLGDGFRCR